jgi:uncharacterized protein
MHNHLCHFEIPADDVPALQNFYNGLFGWTFEKMPGPIEYHIIKTPAENMCGGLMPRQNPQQGPVNYIAVESLDATLAKAAEAGATVIMPKTPVPGMGWFAVLFDPQRNPFGLWQDDTSAA